MQPTDDGMKEAACRVIDHFNERAGRMYRHSRTTIKPVLARLKEGYTEETLIMIVDEMCRRWKGDPVMESNLKPSTLFRPSHIEDYEQFAMSSRGAVKKKPLTAGELFG